MDGSHRCASCGAGLEAEDGHDLCPACLGHDHLMDALSENPCMNCSYMPRAVRAARLAQLGTEPDEGPPLSGQMAVPRRSKRRTATDVVSPPKKRRVKPDQGLSRKVAQLSAELAEIKALFQTRQQEVSIPGSPCLSWLWRRIRCLWRPLLLVLWARRGHSLPRRWRLAHAPHLRVPLVGQVVTSCRTSCVWPLIDYSLTSRRWRNPLLRVLFSDAGGPLFPSQSLHRRST